jgi:hypothetical protein
MTVIEFEIRKAAMPAPPMAHQLVRGGLDDHVHLAAGHDVAAEHEAEEQDDADDLEHDEEPPRRIRSGSSRLMLNPR